MNSHTIPPFKKWMQDFFSAGDIAPEIGFSHTSDGLHVAWHECTGTGFVFGDSTHTGADYRNILDIKRMELQEQGGYIRHDFCDSSFGVGGFMYSLPSRRAA